MTVCGEIRDYYVARRRKLHYKCAYDNVPNIDIQIRNSKCFKTYLFLGQIQVHLR